MLLVDILAHYAFFLKWCVLITTICMLISGIDDLIVDLLYWGRTIYRAVIIRPRHKRLQVEQLYIPEQQPFAVIVPAWKEDGVIRQMVENTLSTYDYKTYRIFVGAYRNDPPRKPNYAPPKQRSHRCRWCWCRMTGLPARPIA